MDTGDHVIIINADKVRLTGKKLVQKVYFRHPVIWAAINILKQAICFAKNPVRMVELAVRGMVPHNRLGSQIIKNCMYTLVLNILMLHKSLKF